MCTSVPENFLKTKFCWIVQVDGIINLAKYFTNRLTRMSLAIGQTAIFSANPVSVPITTVVYYQNIISWCFFAR